MSNDNKFIQLAAIDVSKKTEKKNGLTYLSWAFAVDQLLRADAGATWSYGEPVKWGDTVMVFCTVTAFGKAMTAQLPVMDHRNKAIPNPDAFQVNVTMQRALAKAIALHGIGLYIYAGEDLPPAETESGVKAKETPANGNQSAGITSDQLSELGMLSTDSEKNTKIEAALKKHNIASIEKLSQEQAEKLLNWIKK